MHGPTEIAPQILLYLSDKLADKLAEDLSRRGFGVETAGSRDRFATLITQYGHRLIITTTSLVEQVRGATSQPIINCHIFMHQQQTDGRPLEGGRVYFDFDAFVERVRFHLK